MGNTFLTAQEIARQALPILSNNIVMPALMHTDFSEEFKKKGDVIQVEKPAVFVADEFGTTINLQDINPEPVLVKLDKIADVSVSIGAKEMALNLEDFNRQVLEPAVVAIADKINNDALGLYANVPYFVGTSGTTPDGLDDFANARKSLNTRKVPLSPRYAVWNPDAEAKFSVLDSIVNAEKSGSNLALREGSIGRVGAFDNFMAQGVKTHTAGGYTAATAPKIKTQTVAGDTIALKASAGTGKLLKGDLLTIAGKQYVVKADTANAVTNDIDVVTVYPDVPAGITVDTVVAFADATAGGHVANMAFHKSAFCFVNRPLEMAPGTQSYVTSFNGISVRIVMAYDITTKKTIMSIDTLYGVTPLYPELATRVLG